MPSVSVVVGAQWGDEGKGKWIDIFARNTDIVARFQGGNNAGHTLFVDGKKIVLHQIPSGIFHPGTTAALGAGVVINPVQMCSEIEGVQQTTELEPSRFWLSARAHVITPWHIYLDGMKEKNTDNPIGTTRRGIGPTYADKSARLGIRLGHFIDADHRNGWIKRMGREVAGFAEHVDNNECEWQTFHDAATILKPYVCDAEDNIRRALKDRKRLLLEGAQGALLDIDHGTYPFVTSSSTMAGGSIASIGFAAKHISGVYGIAKAYATRVGEGPFPSELFDQDGEKLAQIGHEFGATTGRARRCGWLDTVALKYSYHANGCDALILNKMDVLDTFPTVKLCIAYEHPVLGRIDTFPWDPYILRQCRPVFESLRGWNCTIPKTGSLSSLPEAAKVFIARIEQLIDGKISMVGTGVNRSDALFRN